MPSRDVEINLIAHDRTGQATHSAAKNLEQLARKTEKLKSQTTLKTKLKVDSGEAKKLEQAGKRSAKGFGAGFRNELKNLKLDAKFLAGNFANRTRKIFGQSGRRSGVAFTAGLLKAVTFGQLGQGFAHAAIRAAPAAARMGGALGAAVAGALVVEMATALSAAVPLLLGATLLAAPVAFLVHQQLQGLKQVTVEEKKIATLKKRLELAKGHDAKVRIEKEIAAERRILREQELQGGALLRLKNRAKDFLSFISRPLRIPFAKSLNAIGDGLNAIKYDARDLTRVLAPGLKAFTKGAMKGLASFIAAIKPALPNIVTNMREWGRVMPQITASVGTLLAKLSSNPKAVQAFADSFDTLAKDLGDALLGLENFATRSSQVDAQLRAIRTGDRVAEFQKLGPAMQGIAKAWTGSQLAGLRKWDDWLQSIKAIPGSPFAKMQAAIHANRLKMEADFAAMTAAKARVDRKLSEGSKAAGFKAAISVLDALKRKTKAALNDPHLTKARKIKLEADLSRFNAQMATAKARLHILQKTRSKPKLEADKSRLEKAIKDVNAKLKQTNDKHVKTKLKADKSQAEAALREVNARLNALDGKTAKANITVTTHFKTTGTPAQAWLRRRANIHAGTDFSFSGAAGDGGATHRTGGPTQVNVSAPIVDVHARLDGHEIASSFKSIIVDESKRNAYRSRVGRR